MPPTKKNSHVKKQMVPSEKIMVPSEKQMKIQPQKMFVSENFIRKSNDLSEKKPVRIRKNG